MLLTVSTTTAPARDLGFLLRKHPDRLQTFELPVGSAHVFYPQATDDRCTAALMVDVDPVTLVRGRASSADGGTIESYVNDRAYAISSFMSVAIARIYGQALGGRSDRPELVSRSMDLEAMLTPLRIDEDDLPWRLFGPLGYSVESVPVGAPPEADRAGRYVSVSLSARTTVRDLLTHVYVLVPVLDDQKHYWVGEQEVEKLFRHGGDWLPAHPEGELITRRYLNRAPSLARDAVARLKSLGDDVATQNSSGESTGEASLERPLRLQERRIEAALTIVREAAAGSVADLGCGDGDLLAALAREPNVSRILGADVAQRELERAKKRLERIPMTIAKKESIELIQSSLLYADRRLSGFDVATLLEVVEHVDRDRLPMLARIVFTKIRPRTVILTTPNREYNALFPGLRNGALRHPDHRFEWTRAEFAGWAAGVAAQYQYALELGAVGDADANLGAPTQLAVFRCV